MQKLDKKKNVSNFEQTHDMDEIENGIDLDKPTNSQTPTNTDDSKNKKKLSIAEKRVIIEERLKNNLPRDTIIYFAVFFIEIGLVGIALQIALMVYDAPLNRMGNGIWGGLFAIGNSCLKIYLSKCMLFVFLKH